MLRFNVTVGWIMTETIELHDIDEFQLKSILNNLAKIYSKKKSFFEVLQEKFQNRITKIDQQVEAIVADMDVAAILGIPFGTPIFFGEVIYYDDHSAPVEISHLFLRGDRYLYRTVINLDEE